MARAPLGAATERIATGESVPLVAPSAPHAHGEFGDLQHALAAMAARVATGAPGAAEPSSQERQQGSLGREPLGGAPAPGRRDPELF
jgi:hypothetical protein